ncbi:MAG: hypothetical protein AAGA53_00840 [Pseudomonadota bacterium]
MKIRFLLLLLVVLFGSPAFQEAEAQTNTLPENLNPLQTQWVVEEITDGSIDPAIVPDQRAIAENGLPDGRVTTGTGDIVEAWYTEPTTRYAHAVLGDGIEGGALKVRTNRGEVFTFRPPSTEVFEDIAPRLVDLDLDGRTEVITILSSQFEGASVAIFHLNGNAFIKIAQTPFIGTPNRWLNIAEIDNFGGNRRPDIAIVVTPHLAGVLQFYRFRNDRLVRIAGAAGFSNHFIGSNELRLSAVADVNGNGIPDLVIPSLARNQLVVVGVQGQRFAEIARVRLPARIDRAILARETDGQPEFVVGLDDGKIYRVARQ